MKKKLLATLMAIVLLSTAFLTSLPDNLFVIITSFADDDIHENELTDLYFEYTYIPNQGK